MSSLRVLGYFIEVDLRYPNNIKKNKKLSILSRKKVIPIDNYNDYMKKIKPKNSTKGKKIICDWTDEKNYLIQYRMSKFYVRHVMILDIIHETN